MAFPLQTATGNYGGFTRHVPLSPCPFTYRRAVLLGRSVPSKDRVCVSPRVSALCYGQLRSNATVSKNKKAELSLRRPRDAPNIWVPWKVSTVLTTHPATFSKICNGLLFRSILKMCVQNLKFVALSVLEIIGGTQKIGQSLDTPTLHFLPNFLRAFVRMDPLNIPAKFEFRSFIHSSDNRGTQKFGQSLDTPTLHFLTNF